MSMRPATPAPQLGLLYLAYLTSLLGSWAFRIGVIVKLLQHDAGALGLGMAVIYGPIIIGSLLLAPLVDRTGKLSTMIVVDLVRAAAMLPLLFVAAVGSPTTYIAIALLSITQPVFNAAQSAFVRATREPADLVTVFRNLSNIEWITYVVGMALGVVLLTHFSLKSIVIANGLSYVASAVLLATLRRSVAIAATTAPAPDTRPSGALSDLRPLSACFAVIFLLNLGAGIINVYPVVKVADGHFGDGAALSAMIAVNGIFGFLGTLCVKSVYTRMGALKSMTLAAVLIAASLGVMAIDGGLVLAIVASSLMLGIGQIFAVSAQTHMVASAPEGRAGKLAGLLQFCMFGGITLNGLLFALLADRLSFGAIVGCCAACALTAGLISLGETLRASVAAGRLAPTALERIAR